ncbi:MAG: Fic family protein [Deltaproteobacteria bacterium]|nr:Fic family protein [Deltaproteobacteria bacterium]
MDYTTVSQKKQKIEGFRPLPPALIKNLDDWFRIELTYNSNAIEGNTLSRSETAVIIEKGLTVGGKSLREHLETTNHVRALEWIKTFSTKKPKDITEQDILDLQGIILKGIDDNAGRYRNIRVKISESAVIFPSPQRVPDLMAGLIDWLSTEDQMHPIELAGEAHFRLVSIHPFVDGNGRTARLLLNMILMTSGYPPALIRKEDRFAYIDALEKAQLGGPRDDYDQIIMKAVDRSLDIYLKALEDKDGKATPEKAPHLRIGQLAKQVQETSSTIRYWTKEGLIRIADKTPAGYQLYSMETIERIKQIKALKEQRYTLNEIKKILDIE